MWSVTGGKSFQLARDGRLEHNAEEGRLIRFGTRWEYILEQRDTRDRPATRRITEQAHAVNDERAGE